MKNGTHVNGNREAVQFLEQITAYARENPIGYAAVALVQDGAGFTGGFTGTVELENRAKESLIELTKMMDAKELNRTNDRKEEYGADYACYNISKSPVSYDFIAWLIDAECTRIRAGAPAPLKVGFFMGRDGKTGLDDGYRKLMLNEVCRPALDLLGAVEDPEGTFGEFKEFFSFRDIVKFHKDGFKVPKWKLSTKSIPYEPGTYVTITLREAEHWPHRNSKLSEWTRFADWLKAQGERVIFVRDTRLADTDLPGYETYPLASTNFKTRLALYQQAKCNLFVANGPGATCFFTDAPWIGFFEIDDEGAYNAAKTVFWEIHGGIKVGEQFPWSTDKQKIVWKPDWYTNLVLAWKELNLSGTP